MTAVSSSSDGSCRAAVRYAKSSADVAATTPEGKREPKRPARPATCTQMEAGQHATSRCSQPMNRAASRPATQPVNHPARFASPMPSLGQTAQPTCLISAVVSRRSWVPSNLRREVKTMRRMDRYSPMPTASADSEMGRWKVHSWGTAAVGTLIDTGCCHARQGPAHPAWPAAPTRGSQHVKAGAWGVEQLRLLLASVGGQRSVYHAAAVLPVPLHLLAQSVHFAPAEGH